MTSRAGTFALGAVGVLALVGGIVLLVIGAGSSHEAAIAFSVLDAIIVWSFGFAGIVALVRRPENRTGLLMIWAGLTWFVSALQLSSNSLLFTIGLLTSILPLGSVTQLLLSFPGGRLTTWPAKATVLTGYVVAGASQVALALVTDSTGGGSCASCPSNLVLVESRPDTADALSKTVGAIAVTVALAALAILIARWRAATAPARVLATPVLASGAIAAAVASVSFATTVAGRASIPAQLATYAAVALIPFAFLAALLRTRLAQGAIGRLLLELSSPQAPGRLREAIARALGDPSLQVAYWVPQSESYVDVHGRNVELPPEGSARAVTVVERDGKRVAALIHDRSVLEQGALVDGVAAAAGLALENERLHAELRARLEQLAASEARLRALVDASPLAIVETAGEGRVTFWNRAAEDLFGWTAAEATGQNISSLIHPGSETDPYRIRRRLEQGGPITGIEVVRRRKDGTLIDVAISAAPILDADGKVVRRMAVAADIGERKRFEAELRASRVRIVEAADTARRRLERNLHDGAQQRLVALSLALRMAKAQVRSNPDSAEETLSAASDELAQALEELRELARGIHPAVLVDRGLEAALEAIATRSPVPVELDISLTARLPAQVEAATYYVVSEALANVAKYAQASSVTVSVGRDNGSARVDVVDDGVGGADPANGSGLRGLADRVEALDGRLLVTSAPGKGTRVHAAIPCG